MQNPSHGRKPVLDPSKSACSVISVTCSQYKSAGLRGSPRLHLSGGTLEAVPFPIIGNIPHISFKVAKHGGIVEAMREWKKEYGPVFTLWMGPQPTVHICDMEIAQETMQKRGNEFADRWMPILFTMPRNGLGIIGTSGERWMEHRRFALHTLRNFGLGRSLMEDRIMEEFHTRFDGLDKKIEDDLVEFDPKPFLDYLIGSIINRMLFNETFDEKNGTEFYRCKQESDKWFERLSFMFLVFKKEIFLKLPIISNRIKHMTEPIKYIKEFLRSQIQKRIDAVGNGSHTISDEPDDFVDAFLLKMKTDGGSDSTYYEDSLVVDLMDLWIAGQDTTVTTIMAGLGYLLNNTDVILNVREELSSVTQGFRDLALKDKPNTPYFLATLTEIQRHASILNMNLFRRVHEDTFIGEHPIAKGTPVTAQISVLMSDNSRFKDSDKFNPSRFLIGDKLEQYVIPFGIGKRACLGESLARAELYLIFGNFILRYHLEPSEELPVTKQVNNIGLMKRPNPFTMRIRRL